MYYTTLCSRTPKHLSLAVPAMGKHSKTVKMEESPWKSFTPNSVCLSSRVNVPAAVSDGNRSGRHSPRVKVGPPNGVSCRPRGPTAPPTSAALRPSLRPGPPSRAPVRWPGEPPCTPAHPPSSLRAAIGWGLSELPANSEQRWFQARASLPGACLRPRHSSIVTDVPLRSLLGPWGPPEPSHGKERERGAPNPQARTEDRTSGRAELEGHGTLKTLS